MSSHRQALGPLGLPYLYGVSLSFSLPGVLCSGSHWRRTAPGGDGKGAGSGGPEDRALGERRGGSSEEHGEVAERNWCVLI